MQGHHGPALGPTPLCLPPGRCVRDTPAHNARVTKPLTAPWLRKLLAPLKWLLALVILFEEWGWEPLQRVLVRIGRWPGFAWIESAVRRAPPWLALLLFCVPALLLLPVKLMALWLIGMGHALTGLALIVLAKLAGTAIVARLFSLTQPTLMQLAWFVRWYGRWIHWKGELLAQVRASGPWRMARVLRRQTRRWWRGTSAR